MKLFSQLILIVSAIFTVVFAGALAVIVSNMHAYLADQLESHAQDTATSLSLSIQTHAAKDDISAIDTVVNSVFDPGYYLEISVEKPGGVVIVRKVNDLKVENVPQWFVKLISLEAPRREALISTGWIPYATVHVHSHPGYAYIELWKDTVGMFWWFLVGLALSIGLGALLLRLVLNPLDDVERQANAIANKDFVTLENLPWTKELRSVVIAINAMSGKLKRIIEEDAALAKRLRDEAYVDPVTGFNNRRSFDIRLEHIANSKEEIAQVFLIKTRISDFVGYNKRNGWEMGDRLLVEVANLIKKQVYNHRDIFLARIAGGEFAILGGNTSLKDVENIGKSISDALKESTMKSKGEIRGADTATVGVAYVGGLVISAQKLMSAADLALKLAEEKGPNAWYIYKEEDDAEVAATTEQEWERLIATVIRTSNATYLYQPAMDIDGDTVLHYEALARILGNDGTLVPAAYFMPMVEKFKMTVDLDKMLVEKLVQLIKERNEPEKRFAINIFPQSLNDSGFRSWLYKTLEKSDETAKQMILELPEKGAIQNLDLLEAFIDDVGKTGATVGLDNFGATSKSFDYLSDLNLEYIKIDGSYFKDIACHADNQLFVQSIVKIAHGLEALVIAKSIETAHDLETVAELMVDGAQGFYLGKPHDQPATQRNPFDI